MLYAKLSIVIRGRMNFCTRDLNQDQLGHDDKLPNERLLGLKSLI